MQILWTLALLSTAHAENSFLTDVLDKIHAPSACAQLRPADVFTSACLTHRDGFEPLRLDAANALENMAFADAVPAQIDKDRCAAQRARALANTPALFGPWRDILQQTWLRQRKVKLMRDFCDEHFLRQEHPTDRTKPDDLWRDFIRQDRIDHQYPVEVSADHPAPKNHALQEERETTLRPWKDVCLSRDALDSLKATEAFLPASLPLANAPEFFAAMDDNRQLIKDFVSGDDLTDPEILQADLRDFGNIDVRTTRGLDDQLRARLKAFADERDASAGALEDKMRTNPYGLSDQQKQYMYDEGTFDQTLTRRLAREPERAPLAEACMASRFKPSPGRTAVEFAATAVLSGGLYLAALRGVAWVRAARGAAQLARAGETLNGANLVGAALASSDLRFAKHLIDACSPEPGKFREADRLAQTPPAASRHLDPHVGYQKLDVTFDPKQTPACNAEAPRTLLINTVQKSSCLGETIGNGFSFLATGFSLLTRTPAL